LGAESDEEACSAPLNPVLRARGGIEDNSHVAAHLPHPHTLDAALTNLDHDLIISLEDGANGLLDVFDVNDEPMRSGKRGVVEGRVTI
jgi:hypothetical protein